MTTPPDISGISERDIDLLLLEELWANVDFRNWFIPRCSVGASGASELIDVKRSVTTSSGESDLELTWRRSDGTIAKALIENKVDAGFQQKQAERYRQRAVDSVSNGRCAAAWTVLLAPSAYYGSDTSGHGFDICLTHEAIRDWFLNSALGARGAYKAGVLTAAINKAALGYNPVADDAVSRFWQAYWEISVDEAPDLAMNRPTSKPSGSTWIYFAAAGLPRNVSLVHKLQHGYVELTLAGLGERVGELRAALSPVLERDMVVDRAAKSASIRIEVPKINIARDISEARAAVSDGLSAALRLLGWARANRERLDRFVGGPG